MGVCRGCGAYTQPRNARATRTRTARPVTCARLEHRDRLKSLVRHYRELIAYGAGWTDPDRQRPVGDTGRYEPAHIDAIIDAELKRALEDRDPLRGLAQLTARLGAAFLLDVAGVTRTKALGTERMARTLRDALPGGDSALRSAVWEFMRPMLSPTLVALNRGAFIVDGATPTTVDLDAHRSASDLDELDIDQGQDEAA